MKRSKNYDNYRFIIHEHQSPKISTGPAAQVLPDVETPTKFYTLLSKPVPIMEQQGMDSSQRLVEKS